MKNMKIRNLFVAICFSLIGLQTFAQTLTFNEKDKVFNLGFGFGNRYYGDSYYDRTFPPISLSLEYCVADGVGPGSIGIGAFFAYQSFEHDYGGWGYRYSDIVLGGRGAYHLPLIDKFDTYGGIMLAYRVVSSSTYGAYGGITDGHTDGSAPFFSLYAGGRYYLSSKFAIMGEVGYAYTWLTLGLSFKF